MSNIFIAGIWAKRDNRFFVSVRDKIIQMRKNFFFYNRSPFYLKFTLSQFSMERFKLNDVLFYPRFPYRGRGGQKGLG